MKDNIFLAKKYAKAFDSCAKTEQEAKQNFAFYQNALKNIEPLKIVVENPSLAFTLKKPLLEEVLGQDIGAAFICFLISVKRFNLVPQITKELLLLLDKRQNLIRAQITTAKTLENKEQQEIKKVLENYFKKDIALTFLEDKNILGGMIIKQEDLCIDGSVSGQLENLKQVLKR